MAKNGKTAVRQVEKRCMLTILRCSYRRHHMSQKKELRKGPAFMFKNPDAAENMFGALVQVDWLDMTRGSGAYWSPQRALVFTDDVSLFFGGSATPIDDVPPRIRRLGSDRGAGLEVHQNNPTLRTLHEHSISACGESQENEWHEDHPDSGCLLWTTGSRS